MKAARTDIDIDVRDREQILSMVRHIPASRMEKDDLKPHPTGVYFHDVPYDPVTECSSIPFKEAEEIGFFKVDFLNVSIYDGIRDEGHLIALMQQEPVWELLQNKDFVETQQIWQLHNHAHVLQKMKPTTIDQLAMTVAIIRPSKLHLIGRPWDEVETEIWSIPIDPTASKSYFKKAHSYSYAFAIVVQLNLIVEKLVALQS